MMITFRKIYTWKTSSGKMTHKTSFRGKYHQKCFYAPVENKKCLLRAVKAGSALVKNSFDCRCFHYISFHHETYIYIVFSRGKLFSWRNEWAVFQEEENKKSNSPTRTFPCNACLYIHGSILCECHGNSTLTLSCWWLYCCHQCQVFGAIFTAHTLLSDMFSMVSLYIFVKHAVRLLRSFLVERMLKNTREIKVFWVEMLQDARQLTALSVCHIVQ